MDDAAIGKNGTKSASTENPGSGMMGEIGGIINKIYTPDINWKKELKRYLKGFSYKNEDIGYNKKHITYGRYNRLVDKEGQTAKRLLVCVDTSGSVVYSGDYLRRIVANVADIVTKLGVKYINVIQFADGVYRDTEFRGTTLPSADKFAIKAETGGTNYDKVFDYIDTKYINKHKSFQSVIFFTDMDVTWFVRNSLYNKNKVPKYANKTVWVILDNGSSKQTIDKKLFGKQIFLSPEEFDKRLNFIKDFKNENYNPYCMNRKLLHINEGGNPFKKIKNTNISLNNEPVNNAADNNVGIKKPRRISALAARRMVKFNEITVATKDNYDIDTLLKINNWLKSNLNDRIPFVCTTNDYYHFKSNKYIELDKNSGQLHVVGDLILLGSNSLEFPKYIKFDTVEGNLILGNNCKLESLPAGLPQIVNGNVTIFGMRRLKDLEGSPISVGGTFSVSSCKNLKSLEGAPEKCGYFYSDNFTNDDYQAYLTDAYGVHECLQYKGNNMFLNEAFNSYKLTSLFNNPINKKALDTIKQINIMWSKIPDTIIAPIYNNVARSLQKRRDDNTSGKYGIYIWCDKFDKIYIIATGNNKSDKYDLNNDWSGGRGWLYVDPQVYDTINQRMDLVNFIYNSYKKPNIKPDAGVPIHGYYTYPWIIAKNFNNNVDEVKQYCDEIGVKYDNKNIINIAQKNKPVGFTKDLTYYHLLLIPDLCAHAYLIQGTKDPHIPEDYSDANFSYNNSKRQREKVQQSRAEMIKNVIVQGRNLNKKDPAYQKYFDEFYLTDEKILEKFTNVVTLRDLRSLIKDEISSVTKMVSITRRNIINFGIKDELIETFDLLTAKFNSMNVKGFIKTATATIDIINYALTHLRKDYNDAFLAIIELLMRGFTVLDKNNFTSNIFYNNNDIKLRARLAQVKTNITNGNVLSPELYISDCSLAWVVYYTRIVETLSTINSYIDNLKSGKITSDDILKILM